MKKEQDNNIIDYNKIYNEIYHKVMNQLNEKQNNQNLNALLDPEIKNEVQQINQKCEYCLFNDINITLTENDLNKYFLMKITGKTKVAKLCEFYTSKYEFAFVLSDGVVYITDEKGKTTWNDIFIVQKLQHFPNIDLTENTIYGDIFITKNGQKLKYVYKLASLNNTEFIYVFTDENKMYHFNRYGEYEAYNNGINLYVKYEENNTNNNLLDIASDIIKQSNDNFNDLMKEFNHNKQNTYITNNNNYNKKYNHIQYKKTQETPQEKVEHIKQIIDKLDNEYNGDIRDKVTIKNEDTDIISDFPLKTDSIYINEEDLSIIYVKSINPLKTTQEVEILADTYMFNDDEEYVLYKNEYYNYDFSDLSKKYTIEQLKLYREISQDEVNNVVNNIKIMQDNINEIKRQFKNLLKNLIFINKHY
jgi:hypothetical protein